MKLPALEPASKADWLATAEGLPDVYFETFSGVKIKHERAKFRDGFSASERTAATGSTKFEDVTFSKSFDPEIDEALITWLQTLVGGKYVNFSIRPVMRQDDVKFRGRKSWKLSNCRLMAVNYPDSDVNSPTEVSKIELIFSVDLASYN